MNLNNFTIKAQEAVQKAQEIAVSRQNQAIETSHVLKGILTVDENVVPFLLKKMEVNVVNLGKVLDSAIASLPKVAGGEMYLSPRGQQRPYQSQPKRQSTPLGGWEAIRP